MNIEEYPPLKPSAHGFRSIRPKSRKERRSVKDKVALEKSRIDQRTGWQARMHRQNAPESSAMLTSCASGAAGYLSNSDRFHTDTVGEEYANRQENIQRKLKAAEFRRNQSTKRDEMRWHANEEKQQMEEEYWSKLRADGSKAKKNSSNVAYDIMTLQYSQDHDGQHQKYLDDMGKSHISVPDCTTICTYDRANATSSFISYLINIFFDFISTNCAYCSSLPSNSTHEYARSKRRHKSQL